MSALGRFGEWTSKSERCVGFWCVCGRETRRAAAPRSKSAWKAARPAARRRGAVPVHPFFDEQLSRHKNLRRGGAARAGGAPLRLRGCAEAALRPRRARAPPVGSKRHKVLFESQGLCSARASRAGAALAPALSARPLRRLSEVCGLAGRRALQIRCKMLDGPLNKKR